ncbi:TolC family protein [Hyphococcus sp.]|uniref:TolC family protein n=1 Tax=Hyphococcus sp. TaxID=2038636 RepID=UPI003D0C7DAE
MKLLSTKKIGVLLLTGLAAQASFAAQAADTAADQRESRSSEGVILIPKAPAPNENSKLTAALGDASYILRRVKSFDEFRHDISAAIRRRPILLQQVARGEEAQDRVRREQSILYPQLSTSLSGDYTLARRFASSTDNVVESLRPRDRFTGGITASQLLFDGGATSQRIKSAKAYEREQAHTLVSQVNDLALSAISAYYDLALQQALDQFGQKFIARQKALLNDVFERESLGAGSHADVIYMRAKIATFSARVLQNHENMKLAEIKYGEFFDTETERLFLPLIQSTANPAHGEDLDKHDDPEIQAAIARSEQAQADFKAERASRIPELRIKVDASGFDILDRNPDYDIRGGVDMQFDLFTGGARKAAIEKARAFAQRQKFDEERIRQEVERDTAITFERRIVLAERLQSLAEAVIAEHAARDLVIERFRISRGDLRDVLQAESDYFEAGEAYLTALAELDLVTYELMEHTGDLTRYFSPQTHELTQPFEALAPE